MSEFSAEGVEFLLVGAYALAVHGLPRATGDLDLWILPSPENADRVLRALQRFGAPLESIDRGDFTREKMVVQIGVAPRRIDIMTSIEGVDFAEAWPSRKTVVIDGIPVPVLGRSDFIRNKRALGRPKDIADIEGLSGEE